jgi:hypothetical protein
MPAPLCADLFIFEQPNPPLPANLTQAENRGWDMTHRGVEFSLLKIRRDAWHWEFRIGRATRSGVTQTTIEQLAVRRVQQQIDRSLREMVRAAAEPHHDSVEA